MEAAKKSTSSSSSNSIPGLIFEAAEIHRFLARSADKYLKLKFLSYSIEATLIKVINVGSDTFGNPIFHEGLQN